MTDTRNINDDKELNEWAATSKHILLRNSEVGNHAEITDSVAIVRFSCDCPIIMWNVITPINHSRRFARDVVLQTTIVTRILVWGDAPFRPGVPLIPINFARSPHTVSFKCFARRYSSIRDSRRTKSRKCTHALCEIPRAMCFENAAALETSTPFEIYWNFISF